MVFEGEIVYEVIIYKPYSDVICTLTELLVIIPAFHTGCEVILFLCVWTVKDEGQSPQSTLCTETHSKQKHAHFMNFFIQTLI